MTAEDARPTAAEIEEFLRQKFAAELSIELAEIDCSKPLVAYGLDSVAAVGISGELERWLNVRLSPTLLYDNPTITALARAIAEMVRAPQK